MQDDFSSNNSRAIQIGKDLAELKINKLEDDYDAALMALNIAKKEIDKLNLKLKELHSDSLEDHQEYKRATTQLIKDLRDENARYREVLELYANPFKYKEKINNETSIPDFYDETDFGMFAREALKGGE